MNSIESPETILGKRLLVVCDRYCYRGIVSSVGRDFLVFVNGTNVESWNEEEIERETPLKCAFIINLSKVETLLFPHWLSVPLPLPDECFADCIDENPSDCSLVEFLATRVDEVRNEAVFVDLK